jgi:hypothetical protein
MMEEKYQLKRDGSGKEVSGRIFSWSFRKNKIKSKELTPTYHS